MSGKQGRGGNLQCVSVFAFVFVFRLRVFYATPRLILFGDRPWRLHVYYFPGRHFPGGSSIAAVACEP